MSSSERAVQVLVKTDPEFVELCKALYGPVLDADVIWGDVFGQQSAQTDILQRSVVAKKLLTDERKKKIAETTNTLGAAAGPAAVYGAVRAARSGEGGIPRDALRFAAKKKPGGRLERLARAASKPIKQTKGKHKAALIAAGGFGVVQQAANTGGDVIASQEFRGQRKAREAAAGVSKDVGGLPPLKSVVNGIKTQKTAQAKAMLKPTGNKINATTTTATPTRSGSVGAPGVTPPAGVGGNSSGVTPGQAGLSKRAPDFVAAGEFSKFDDDQRLAFGWASVVEKDGLPVIDRQGDYISATDMEKAAYVYVEKSRVGGDMHKRAGFAGERPHHVADLVESMVFTKEKISKMGLPDSTPVGWWVGFRVNDEDVWKSVKQGGHTGFSIHGKGKRAETSIDDVVGY